MQKKQICSRCGAANPDDAFYCAKCGERLGEASCSCGCETADSCGCTGACDCGEAEKTE